MASHTAAAQDAVGSAGRRLMAPPLPRAPAGNSLRKPLVLEEEEWAEALEAIIERDFFPDIPKLQSKLEWLQVRLHCSRPSRGSPALCDMPALLLHAHQMNPVHDIIGCPHIVTLVHGDQGDEIQCVDEVACCAFQ